MSCKLILCDTQLDICFFFYLDDFDGDTLYTKLFRKFPDLTEIRAEKISERAIQVLGGPALKVANIRSSENSCMTREFLKEFSIKCPNLVNLSIIGENEVASDKAVHVIVTNCLLLETLELSSRCELTDLSFMHLASLQHLKSLSLDWGSAMTSEAASVFLQSMGPHLEVLSLNVTEEVSTLFDDILLIIGRYCSWLRGFKCLSE